jgi:hypothetical protein
MTVVSRALRFVALLMIVAGAAPAARAQQAQPERFPHDKHAKLFPLCATCHAGITAPGEPLWPSAASCRSCHDGQVTRTVTWEPRAGPRAGNLRFTHEGHTRAAFAKNTGDSALTANCGACHTATGAARMAVRPVVLAQCLECHQVRVPHTDAPSTACATCHVPLAGAPSLTAADVAHFPKPASHSAPGFRTGEHGIAARVPGAHGSTPAISASCATCHSRALCITCHVNAPESPVIQALAVDQRSPRYHGTLPTPSSHTAPAFLTAHGKAAQRDGATCATCHTRESCATCHTGSLPRSVAALPAGGPGRAAGAQPNRKPPASHTWEFRDRHGPEANARQSSCEGCHTRSSCLECHRPDPSHAKAFHPAAFLTRHPSAAYTREANCSDCHNPAQFCQSCHQKSGLVATRKIGRAGYHDAFRGFSLGHGQAARQSLESCASCHAERDCTACHSAVSGGFGFSPHGPGFNAARMRAKNSSVCVACHGRAIPRTP